MYDWKKELNDAARDLPFGGKVYRNALDVARNRTIIASILLLFVFGGICGRLGHLAFTHTVTEPMSIHDAVRPGFHLGRGDIVDRHGVVLATSVTTMSLYANAKKVLNPEEAARTLAKVLPKSSYEGLLKRLKTGKKFIWLARHLTPQQHDAILHLGLPGIHFMKDSRRIYTHGPLLAHVVGLTNVDGEGIAGVEKTQDDYLRTSGEPLVLSVDVRLQHIVRDTLIKGMEEFQATGAAAILLNLESEEILAMASLPDYNPNKTVDLGSKAYFNKATLGMYEMGSTFKLLNTAMVLDSGVATLATKFDTSEPLKIGRFSITDYRASYGVINVAQIFVHSSNRGSARMALAAGMERQRAFLEKLGLFSESTVELPEFGKPLFPKHWRKANSITASYGYGIAVSPLHLLNASASIVGGGCKKQATLLKRSSYKAKSCERIVSEKISRLMRQLLRFVVTDGKSKLAEVPGYFVGGKTGTRNMLINGRYSKERVSTSFVGIIGESADKPKYMVVVLLEDPKPLKKTFGFTTAGWNAAPIAGKIMGRVAPLMGLKPNPAAVTQGIDPFFSTVSFKKHD